MTLKRMITALAVILAAAGCARAGGVSESLTDASLKALCKDLPFKMEPVSLPKIPSRKVLLTDFGAVGDGRTLNTEAFAKAVESLSSKGGGHLVVPAGIWLTGPIGLESGIDLHLEQGAVILFSPDRDLYPIIGTSFEGLDCRRCESPVHADGAVNVAITGRGVIDGCGDSWRAVKKSKLTSSQWKAKLASGGVLSEDGKCWYPDEGYMEAEKNADMNVPRGIETEEQWQRIKSFLRPVMISLRNCENVFLEGVTFQNSPSWNIHPLLCKNLVINEITVRNPVYSQNGDGIDIESCERSVLLNSSFDCGDDGICIKSGKDEDGRRRGVPCKGLLVDGCTVYKGHGGFVVGSEMSGGVEDILVRNCRFLGTDVGLRFKSKRGRGGIVRNIWIEKISMMDIVTEPLLFDLHYGGKSAVEAAEEGSETIVTHAVADETTPCFRDIHIKDIVCYGAARAMYFNGIPEMPVHNVTLENCTITSRKGAEISYAEYVTLKGVDILNSEGERLTVRNSQNVTEE